MLIINVQRPYNIKIKKEVIHLDIMSEAHEYHSIEQYDRKGKHEKQFLSEMDSKVELWNEISERFQAEKPMLQSDVEFMLQEISFLLNPTLTAHIPYLKGFSEHVKSDDRFAKGIEIFYEVLHVYFEFERFVSYQYLPFFNKNKVLLACFEEAKRVVSVTKEEETKLKMFLEGGYSFEEQWEEIEEKWENIQPKSSQIQLILPDEMEWLLGTSRYSILEQLDFGDLYFAHHFQRVNRNEYYYSRMDDCKSLFLAFNEAITKLSKMTIADIPLFDKKWIMQEIQETMKNAKFGHYSEYLRVRQRVQGFMKEKEE